MKNSDYNERELQIKFKCNYHFMGDNLALNLYKQTIVFDIARHHWDEIEEDFQQAKTEEEKKSLFKKWCDILKADSEIVYPNHTHFKIYDEVPGYFISEICEENKITYDNWDNLIFEMKDSIVRRKLIPSCLDGMLKQHLHLYGIYTE